MEDHIATLSSAPLHRFADWPNREIPRVCAGVYAVYDRAGAFVYVGMAGASLDDEQIRKKTASRKRSGLYDRLNSHARGYRSGDRFNIYIGDLFVLRSLSPHDIAEVAAGRLSLDSRIRAYIRAELSYRYIVLPYTAVRELERRIQAHGINSERPRINGIG